MCAKIKHFFENLILAHKRYDKKVGFVGFWGLQIAKNTEQWRDEATCYFFYLDWRVSLRLYKREKTKTSNNTATVNKRLSRPNKGPIKKTRETALETQQ